MSRTLFCLLALSALALPTRSSAMDRTFHAVQLNQGSRHLQRTLSPYRDRMLLREGERGIFVIGARQVQARHAVGNDLTYKTLPTPTTGRYHLGPGTYILQIPGKQSKKTGAFHAVIVEPAPAAATR